MTVAPGRILARWREDPHLLELGRASLVSLLVRAAAAGTAFALTALIARRLDSSEAGLYFLAGTVLVIGAVVGRLGLDDALLRFSAANVAVGDWRAVKGVYRTGMSLLVAGAILSALLLLFSADWIATSIFRKPELIPAIRWAGVALVPFSLFMVHGEMLKGARRQLAAQLVQGVAAPALTVVLILSAGRALTAERAMAMYAAACAVTALFGWWCWRRAQPAVPDGVGHVPLRDLLASSVPAYAVALLNLLLSWSAIVMLGIWGTSADVARFGLSARTVLLANFLLLAVTSAVSPQYAALYRRGELGALQTLARRSTLITLAGTAPILAVLLLAPGFVLSIFGPEYRTAAPMLVILTMGEVVNVATGAVGYLLMMTGHERHQRNNHVATAIVTVGLGVLLIPRYGGVGAAIATAMGTIVLNLSATVLVWRHLGIAIVPWPASVAARRDTP